MVKNISLLLLSLFMVSCSTTTDGVIDVSRRDRPSTTKEPIKASDEIMPSEIQVDMDQLQQVLNMRLEQDKLGYFEKPFNTCKAGSGYSATHNCKQMVFTLIQFRLRCRDTDGTTSEVVNESNLQDISYKNINWRLKPEEGSGVTNGGGYGSIRGVFKKSPRNEFLQLSNGESFLYLRANQIKTAITPSNWCY